MLLRGKRHIVASIASMFYDLNDQLYAILIIFTPHSTIQPLVKPVILHSFCHTCSKPDAKVLNVVPLCRLQNLPSYESPADPATVPSPSAQTSNPTTPHLDGTPVHFSLTTPSGLSAPFPQTNSVEFPPSFSQFFLGLDFN